MSFRLKIFFAVLFAAAVPLFGDSLVMNLSSNFLTGQPGQTLIFNGTLVDTDTDNSFLFLNDIMATFASPGDVYLSLGPHLDNNPSEPNAFFFNNVYGDLEGDGVQADDTYPFTGLPAPIFEVVIAPNTPDGTYTGSINILGGYNGPGVDFNPLFTNAAGITILVNPEPGVWIMTLSGLAALAIFKRRRSSCAGSR